MLLLAEFILLVLLGGLLMKLIAWEHALQTTRADFLAGLRQSASELRTLRRKLEEANRTLPDAPSLTMLLPRRGKWRWLARLGMMALSTRRARS